MTPSEIMRELTRDDIFPQSAMTAAGTDREALLPVFVDLLDRLGRLPVTAMKNDDLMALLPVFHLLGEWRDPRAYRPVVHMLRRPTKTLEYLLGDAITETSFRVVAGTFDGDLQPIFDAILDPRADDFARSSLMSSLVLIVQLDPAQRPAVEAFIRSFRKREPKAPTDVLTGWMDAVADLGLEDMADDVREVFDRGLIPKDYCDFKEFEKDLQATLEAQGVPANRRYRNSLITDAISELSKWHCYSDAYLAQQRADKVNNMLRVAPWTEAVETPATPAGRNDPCPCGSGRKFKKCCLH